MTQKNSNSVTCWQSCNLSLDQVTRVGTALPLAQSMEESHSNWVRKLCQFPPFSLIQHKLQVKGTHAIDCHSRHCLNIIQCPAWRSCTSSPQLHLLPARPWGKVIGSLTHVQLDCLSYELASACWQQSIRPCRITAVLYWNPIYRILMDYLKRFEIAKSFCSGQRMHPAWALTQNSGEKPSLT